MAKLIQLKISQIKYGGDSIGEDIRIEIECLNHSFSLSKRIKNNSAVTIDAEIGQFFLDQASSQLILNIKIIEQDLIFNDVGSKEVKITVDLRNGTSTQVSTHEIMVKELRGLFPSRSTAIFFVTIEAVVTEATRYVPNTPDGWLVGKRVDTKTLVSLPAYLKVRFDRVELKREYFTIMEGSSQGIQISVGLDGDASRLLQENPQTGTVSMKYSIAKKALRIQNKTYLATDDPNAKWKTGLYDIEIPDAPHRGGLYYPETKYGKVWFRVGHSGDRFIHTGRHSLGCITLIEQNQWDDLCQTLMKARKGDGKSIGMLEIID